MKDRMRAAAIVRMLPQEVQEAVKAAVDVDGAEFVRKAYVADVKVDSGDERVAVQYVSTRHVDRQAEVLDPKGAILTQFKLAPQVLWGHDYSMPPIGKDLDIRADDMGIVAKTQYAETERAMEVWQLKSGGYLRTSSVGFIPLESVAPGDTGWEKIVKRLSDKWEEFDGSKVGRVHTLWLLLEHSDVSVPANIHALTLAVSKGLMLSDAMCKQLGIEEPQPESEPEPLPTSKRIVFPVQRARPRRIVVPVADVRTVAAEQVREHLERLKGRV